MQVLDVHKTDSKMEKALETIEKSGISKSNKEIIMEFYEYSCTIGLGKQRILKYLYSLFKFSQWMEVPFDKAEKKDILKVVRKIEMKDYSEWTKKTYKIVIKRFYKWLNGNDEIYPDKVKWIKTTFRKNKRKIPEDLITKQELEKMIRVANHSRDRALVSLLYESGFRIAETLNLRIKDIKFDEIGAKIIGNGKTGMRKIRLISSVPYLTAWIEHHPFRDEPDAPIWLKIGATHKDEIICYNSARKIIKTLAEKANIKKRIYPHLFRHSRATELAIHLTDAQMDQYFGWTQGSNMPSTYVHLSGNDLEDSILKINGLKKEEREQEVAVKKCPRCQKMNIPNGKFCIRCGSPLDTKSMFEFEDKRKEMDNLMSLLMRDSEVRNLIMDKLRQSRIQVQTI